MIHLEHLEDATAHGEPSPSVRKRFGLAELAGEERVMRGPAGDKENGYEPRAL
jgi:hypothetical protein